VGVNGMNIKWKSTDLEPPAPQHFLSIFDGNSVRRCSTFLLDGYPYYISPPTSR